MTLEWIWAAIFLLLALISSWGHSRTLASSSGSIPVGTALFIVSIAMTIASVWVSWPMLAGPALAAIASALPQAGSTINSVTAAVLGFLVLGVFFAAIYVGPSYIVYRRAKAAHLLHSLDNAEALAQ